MKVLAITFCYRLLLCLCVPDAYVSMQNLFSKKTDMPDLDVNYFTDSVTTIIY